ncbi:MbcA/ParS/Xre antitoxin family protein [Alkalisalibacterium limincola]|uniref:DUF2384 domain-containing protein n=1 Tax=Alkalisalibacterium limincola TaxID=2699169 RepID=A0A5C8KML9_9GAMM|nr:MbcA/ParS/Xre antitoxin family protein [Alkalisalibacterium limincola]TXK61041.1 DUF2384 domain-containing protein [Alkalisalibacterium limincola]
MNAAAAQPLTPERTQDLGTAGLRTVFRIADEWGLSTAQLMVLLGDPSRTTFFRWKSGEVAQVSRDLLERLSYLVGIYKALQILLPQGDHASAYLKRPNTAPLFAGRTPLQVMLGGQVADLFQVREYLDAQRGW